MRGNLEARGEIPHVATRKDAKGRRQPARKPERHKVPTESQKQVARQVTLQGAARMGAAKAKSEVNEVARLRTRIQEFEAEVHQLNHEKLALQSEVDELRARVSGCPAARPHPWRPAEERMMRRAEYQSGEAQGHLSRVEALIAL